MKKKQVIKKDYSRVENLVDNMFNDKKIVNTNFKLTLPEIKEEIIKEETNILLPLEEKQQIEIIPTAIDTDIKTENEKFIYQKNQSELIDIFNSLNSPDNIEGNTILTNNQVIALSVINYLAQVYDVEFYKQFIVTFPHYRISGDDGRGRKEKIEIANAIRRDKQEEQNRFLEALGRR
jgi:hypothetical protein